MKKGFSSGLVVNNPPADAGDMGLVPRSGRSRGKENGYPLLYSCLGNSMDRRAWQATVHGVTRVRQVLVTKSPPPEAVTETKIQVQAVYLKSNVKKYQKSGKKWARRRNSQ